MSATRSPVNGTLHLNWPKDDPKPARPRNGMSAMEEAFARAGYRPAPRPPPTIFAATGPRRCRETRADAIKAEVVEAAAAFKAMSDNSLAEKLSVEANIAVIRIDLTEMNVADGRDREPGWHYRAQRALAYMKARLAAACVAEVEARRKQQRPQAHHKLLGEHTQQRNLKTAQLDRTDAERFKMAAKAMLPRHTWLAIWAASRRTKQQHQHRQNHQPKDHKTTTQP